MARQYFKVCWLRKAIWERGVGFRTYWFGYPSDHGVFSADDWDARFIESYPVSEFDFVRVTRSQFKAIYDGLPHFSELLGRSVPQYSIVTDGKRYLAVDTQGFDYPRYKSFLDSDGYRLARSLLR